MPLRVLTTGMDRTVLSWTVPLLPIGSEWRAAKVCLCIACLGLHSSTASCRQDTESFKAALCGPSAVRLHILSLPVHQVQYGRTGLYRICFMLR